MTTTLILTIAFFLTVILMLVSLLLFVKAKLSPSGKLKITINGEQTIEVDGGSTLLTTLGNNGVFLPSACGGGGTCAQCKVKVTDGGGEILATEKDHINKKEAAEGERLSCQVAVKTDMTVEVPAEAFDTKKWVCKVRSNDNVATFIKELILELPEGEDVDFRAGGYIQIECPPHEVHYKNFDIHERFHEDWDKFDIWRYVSKVEEPTTHLARWYVRQSRWRRCDAHVEHDDAFFARVVRH